MAASQIAYILLASGSMQYTESLSLSGLSGWLPHFFKAIYAGGWQIFMVTGGTTYNPVFWTMYYELSGSFIV